MLISDGRRNRRLDVVSDSSRVCVGQLVESSVSGSPMARFLSQLGEERLLPERIVLDSGHEVTSKATFVCSQVTKVDKSLHQHSWACFGKLPVATVGLASDWSNT